MNVFVIVVMILESIAAFALVGFSCEIRQRLASDIGDINDAIGKLKWYKFPLKVQRILPILIITAQK